MAFLTEEEGDKRIENSPLHEVLFLETEEKETPVE
jgi:hypothetical protein